MKVESKAAPSDLIYPIAELYRDIGALREKLMRFANTDVSGEWLKHAAAIEEALRRAERAIGHSGIALIVASDRRKGDA